MKIIELHKTISESNDKDAFELKEELRKQKVLFINLMSSPGAGKTTLLSRTILDLKDEMNIGVIEADIDSDVDALKIEKTGALSIQAHTDGMCHVDAGMSKKALDELDLKNIDLVFLENVGNLICPAEYDTGAHKNVMILSIPEGDDKPLKYPLIFSKCDVLLLTKIDTINYFNFDFEKVIKRVKKLNPNILIFPVSSKTGEGMKEFEDWLKENRL